MIYEIQYTSEAQEDLFRLAKSEPSAYKKAVKLIQELSTHPTTGTGKPEPLKGNPKNLWSRRITKKHRLVYQIIDEAVLVLVLSSYGHYDDK